MDTGLDKRALSETYTVLKQLKDNQFIKIPEDLIEAIKSNMDSKYVIDYKSIDDGILLPDTEKILATIYTNYLSTSEEKIVINRLINISKNNKNRFEK